MPEIKKLTDKNGNQIYPETSVDAVNGIDEIISSISDTNSKISNLQLSINDINDDIENSTNDILSVKSRLNSLEVLAETLNNDKYVYDWINNGYIDNTNGEVTNFDIWRYTDFVTIKNGIKYLSAYTTLDGSFSYNAFYDENKEFISNFNCNETDIEVPANAVYFRLSSTMDADIEIYNSLNVLDDKYSKEEVDKKLDALFIEIAGVDFYAYEYNWIGGGYIDNMTGDMIELFQWKYTDYIRLSETSNYLSAYTTLDGSFSYNAFYDVDKKFISNFNCNDTNIEIPDNAVYFRLSSTREADIEVYNSMNQLKDTCSKDDVKSIVQSVINEQGNASANGSINTSDIVYLNKDVEPFVIQASEGLGRQFSNKTQPLVFVHFSDVHTRQNLWDRLVKYVNHYSDYIDFAIHTGDYVGANHGAYVDLYGNGIKCNKPILNVVGNHDTYDSTHTFTDKESTYNLIFNHTENWNVTYMDIDWSMTYYKDYPDLNIRLIALDYYYNIEEQCTWLSQKLEEAKNLGYHVITYMHEMSHVITNKLDTTFQTIDDFESLGGNKYSKSSFDAIIGDWIKAGGIHVGNFAGHEHSDFIGYTDNGVLNICVQCATDDTIWTDAKRVSGTKTYDCFNVVAVETSTGTLKLVRVGNNSDHYLREKKVFVYDYINKKIIK